MCHGWCSEWALAQASEPLRIAELWNVLQAQVNDSQVVLVIDEPEQLKTFESNFVHAVGSLWLLAEEHMRRRLRFLLVGTAARALRDMELALPVESRIVVCDPQNGATVGVQLRSVIFVLAWMPGSFEHLHAWLEDVSKSGTILNMLAAASARELLVYSGQRWKVVPTLLSFSFEPARRLGLVMRSTIFS